MLAVAMAFAAVWGVVQLAVLGWGTRTVRLGTLLLATAAGAFASGAIAIAAELAYTRTVAAVTGDSVAAVVRGAGQTVDPFLEEVAKILPLVVAALHLRTRRQWGLTDFLLLGAAAGAGFALLEAVLRFGHQAAHATRVADGWVLPTSLFPPLVPDPLAVLTSWLPAPANTEFIGSLGEGTGTNLHLVWSAVAGLGVGLWFRLRGHVRWVGPALVLLAGADHASANHDLVPTPGTTLGDVLSAPFRAGQPLVWLWPLLALAAAVVLDVRTLRAARAVAPFPRLRGEGTGTGALRGLARYAALHPPWTSFLVLRFVALRRASLYGCADGVAPGSEPMLGVVADVRARMDVADHPAAWTGVGLRRISLGPDEADRTPAGVLRRFWPVLLWLVLLLPAVLYFLAGTTPSLAGVQDWLERPGVFGAVVAVPAGFALVLLAWQVVTGIHVLPGVFREASGELPAIVQLRVGTALGASLIGVLGVSAWLTGTNPARPLMSAFHAVEALDSLLLVGALALVLAAFLVFPPAIGLTVVGSGPGTTVLVPTVALSSGFATLTVLGTSGVMLSQAVGNSGGDPRPVGGSGSVPDLPRRPTPAKPPVHHWRLRRIVDDLWHGTENPHRIGDGTVMDAVLNEVLTGRPTHGRFHLDKARQAVDRITNWVDEYGNSASRTDRTHAWELRDQLQRALEGR